MAAGREAETRGHEYLTPEHVLYASLFFERGREIILACGGSVEALAKDLEGFFGVHVPATEGMKPSQSVGFQSVMENAVMHTVSSEKEPEFRNRLDAMVKFNALEHAVVLQVVGKAVREFQGELAAKKVPLEVAPACLEWLARKGYSKEFGAWEIARLVSSKLKDFFVDEILFGRLARGGSARADIENNEVVVTVLP